MAILPVKDVPDIVVGRLPVYLRTLGAMLSSGQQLTSSQELAQALDLSSAQIRKDLSHFGEFGKQGSGYNIQRLTERLSEILKLDREWPLVLIGAGHIGSAVANYTGFAHRGFRLVGVFDADPARVGARVGGHEICALTALADIIQQHRVAHALIAVPAAAAQTVANAAIQAGVRAILNYAPVTLSVPKHVHVEYIDPVLHLQRMTFYL